MRKIFIAALVALMASTTAQAQIDTVRAGSESIIETLIPTHYERDPMQNTMEHTTWDSEHLIIADDGRGHILLFLRNLNDFLDHDSRIAKVGLYDKSGVLVSMSESWFIKELSETLTLLLGGYKNENKDGYAKDISKSYINDAYADKKGYKFIVEPSDILRFIKENPDGYIRVTHGYAIDIIGKTRK